MREWRWHGVEKADKGPGDYSLPLADGAITSKEGKARMRRRMCRGGGKKERGRWSLLVVGRTEVWNKRGFATTSETGPRTGRSQGCQRVLGGIQNLLGIGIKKSFSINLSSLLDLPTSSSSGNHSASRGKTYIYVFAFLFV